MLYVSTNYRHYYVLHYSEDHCNVTLSDVGNLLIHTACISVYCL